MNMKRALPINKSYPSMNDYLNADILNIIFPYSLNKDCIFVCKLWHDIIIRCNQKCPKCNKVVNICGLELYANDENDEYCHEYYGQLEDYKTLKTMVGQRPEFIAKIKNQTHKLCEIAVDNNYSVFLHIQDKFKTLKMCTRMVNINEHYLKNVPNNIKTENFWIKMMEHNTKLFKYIEHQTENIIQRNIRRIQNIKNNDMQEC
jgi:hypothetical protein